MPADRLSPHSGPRPAPGAAPRAAASGVTYRKRHKYGAKPVTIDNIRFASQREAAEYQRLKLLERAGKIAELRVQPVFPILINDVPVRALPSKNGAKGRPLEYRADFAWLDLETGARHCVDIKGVDLPVSRLKRALIKHIYGIEIEVRR